MSERPVVCFYIPEFSDGGAQRQCIFLLNELQRYTEFDLVLIRLRPGVHDSLLETSGIRIFDLSASSNFDPRTILRIRQIVRSSGATLLFSWLHSADIFSYFVTRFSPRVTWLLAERDSSYPNRLRYRVRRELGRRANMIIANSSAGVRYWEAAAAKGQIRLADNIAQPPKANLLDDRTDVLFVGRLVEQKGALQIAMAFKQVAAIRPDLTFTMVGVGPLADEISELVSGGADPQQIRMVGFQDDVEAYFARARVVVSLSAHEGLPNVLLEAASFGVPIVASAIPEHTDLLGANYPHLVDSQNLVQSAVEQILAASLAEDTTDLLAHATKRISKMTAASVAETYMNYFREASIS